MSRRFTLLAAVAGLAALGVGCDSNSNTTAVRPVAPIIDLSVDRTAITTTRATVPTFVVQVNRGEGEKTPVSLSVKGLPEGVGAQLSPSELLAGFGEVAVKLLVGPAVTPGSHVLTVEASIADQSKTVEVSLAIYEPEIALSSALTSVVVPQGGAAFVPFNISRVGEVEPVGVSLAQLPERVSASLRLMQANENYAELTLSAAQFSVVGEYTILLRAKASNTRADTVPLRLSIVPGGPSALMLEPIASTLYVPRDGQDSIRVRLLRSGNFSDSVRLELHGATDIRNAGFDFEVRQPSAHDTVATIVFRSLSNQPGVRSILVRAFDVDDNIRALSNFTVRKE